jgi:hypothetical protein
MSDNEADDNTLTKSKKQRSEKQIAATQRMREALQKRQDEFAAKKQPEPPKVNKKEVLKILKEKLNSAKEPSEETDVESEDEPEPIKPVAKEKKAVPAPVVVAKEKPKKTPKYVEPDSESEEEIIVVKKKKKPKKKTIIIEESSSESEEEPIPKKKKKQAPPPVESDDDEPALPTRNTRSQQNKIAKIGVATSVKKQQSTHFFMD